MPRIYSFLSEKENERFEHLKINTGNNKDKSVEKDIVFDLFFYDNKFDFNFLAKNEILRNSFRRG